ncbi:MAG: ammonium transporter [Endomicrobium sp.]|uniref:ammonium transporter n=1 Tax=Candidatus Endomicrobiellum pyrsonymphae TaxID=1408203 RepID=UPI00358703C3|nr:ammonium transporter [Endomicrobium sp.]
MFDAGDTSFIIICTALVLLMTPGLALFYGGLGRRKNMVSNMMNSAFIMGMGIVLYMLVGYSLSFGDDILNFIGSLKNVGLMGITKDSLTKSIPTFAFIAFQMMFALITPAIITGSIAGRMRFKALFLFIALWSIFVYYPLAHMVWGDGGLIGGVIGALDFAGGDVVHISSGTTGLILAILIGRRVDYMQISYRIHNVPFVFLGMGLLLFGWFGFNAGSALAASGLAAHAFMTTAISAAAGMLMWIFIDVMKQGKATLIGACTGVIAGLVGITPAAGFVDMWAALIIGVTVSPVCYCGIALIKRVFKIDDALDAFGCHGIGGIWGGILTGVFVNPAINGGQPGLIYGKVSQFFAQIEGIFITFVMVTVGTLLCAGIVSIFTPLRVDRKEELVGLDISEHGESAYPSFTGLD